jgi:hypothetical protein
MTNVTIEYCKECGALNPDTEHAEYSSPSHMSGDSVTYVYGRYPVSLCCGSETSWECNSALLVMCPSCNAETHTHAEKKTCAGCDWLTCSECLMTHDPDVEKEGCPCMDI